MKDLEDAVKTHNALIPPSQIEFADAESAVDTEAARQQRSR
jgi:hypothetical protein